MRKTVLTLMATAAAVLVQATHIVGGFMSYKYISGNTYEITLTVYRDCLFSQTPFDGTPGATSDAIVGIFYNKSKTLYQTLQLRNPVVTPITYNDTTPCIVPPTNLCVEQGVYTDTITLPNDTTGFTVVHERCCRSSFISNIAQPGDQGSVFSAYIPPTDTFHNTSPVFNQLPPAFICPNTSISVNQSATDSDGDSLSYSLCIPQSGGDVNNPIPSPPLGPPYANIPFIQPYSLNNLMGGVPLAIDYNTGILTGSPGNIGQFAIGVCVSEYRNGQLLATYLHDIQLNVHDCNKPYISIPKVSTNPADGIGVYYDSCNNYTVRFNGLINNPPPFNVQLTYLWDFGVAGSSNDTSAFQKPTYTYADTGTYLVTVITQKTFANTTCIDTNYTYVVIDTVCPVLNTAIINTAKQGFELIPNPAEGYVYIKGDFEEPAKFEVYNLSGQLLLQGNTANNKFSIATLQAGLYIIRVQIGTAEVYRKLVTGNAY